MFTDQIFLYAGL